MLAGRLASLEGDESASELGLRAGTGWLPSKVVCDGSPEGAVMVSGEVISRPLGDEPVATAPGGDIALGAGVD